MSLANRTTPGLHTLARRSITVPLYLSAALLLVVVTPVVLPLTLLADLLRRSNGAWTRAYAAIGSYIACEGIGIAAAAGIWLHHRLLPSDTDKAYRRRNFRLQCWWAATLFRCLRRAFAMRVQVSGDDALQRGNFVLMPRHVSTVDTLLPAIFVSNAHSIRLRYVFKRELLWDPCLDIVGHRLANRFIRRGAAQADAEIERIVDLARSLDADEGVLIYPEGTRFSPAKVARARARVATYGDGELTRLAAHMRHVLPPHLGGPLALLDADDDLDIVFCAHTGFENIERMTDLVNGTLTGRNVRIHFWRAQHSDLPARRQARQRWLFEQWCRVDDWIDANLASAREVS